jgi:ribonucleotide reductase alpha subunit
MEQVLSPGGVCCLGSLNVAVLTDESGIDFEKVKKYTSYLVRFLDNVNTLTNTPLPEYRDFINKKRRIGVGLMGWASSLLMQKIRFASKEATNLRDNLIKLIAKTAYETSIDLAIEKGMFLDCIPEKHVEGPFIKKLGLSDEYLNKLKTTGIRNSSLLSVQPTGNCVTGDMPILINGKLIPIAELIKTKVDDLSNLNEGDIIKLDEEIVIDTFEGIDSFDSIYVNGVQEIVEIELENGLKYTQTNRHKYLIKLDEEYADWVEVKDIKPGMKILAAI